MLVAMTGVRLLGAFATMKCLSLLFGPETFGLLAQIMGVAAIFFMGAGGGSSNGLIKNVSESRGQREREDWLRAALAIHGVASSALMIVALLLWLWAADALFGSAHWAPVFLAIGAAQALVGIAHVVSAYLSGAGSAGTLAALHIVSAVLSAGVLIWLATAAGLEAAAYGLALAPAITGLVSIAVLIRRMSPYRLLSRRPSMDKIGALLKFSGAMLVAVSAVPLAQLAIRANLGEHAGWRAVGEWQAVAKLSDAYMQVFGVLFANFLLPRLAGQPQHAERMAVLKNAASLLLGLYLVGAATLYVLQDFLLRLAYSSAFLPAGRFVLAQLIADLARIAACVFLYYYMAKGRLRLTTAAELYQGIAIYLLYLVLFRWLGEMAAVWNQVVTYGVLLAAVACYFLLENRGLARSRPMM